ncbi:hypothetical protein QVD17_05401 [Tagetes erecta]|uniref:Methyltransferase type 11 domain-containing protein n=1 Tax=Tagetes erecta TaxID=13708 RepID=A0AAD8LI53_TARER|nr:hypothetical protein QVD17_05401 [Tagetes erecta]
MILFITVLHFTSLHSFPPGHHYKDTTFSPFCIDLTTSLTTTTTATIPIVSHHHLSLFLNYRLEINKLFCFCTSAVISGSETKSHVFFFPSIVVKMGRAGRDWSQIYSIYGMDDWHTPIFLLIHAIVFSSSSIMFLVHFNQICYSFESIFPSIFSATFARFTAGFTGSVMALTGVCLFYAAGNMFYSSVALYWDMAQRMVNTVHDWSSVKTVLDVGCSRGILLNSVAMELKKEGSSGRVVGLDRTNTVTLSTLKTAAIEGVQEYVTCREGDARMLPFPDNYFDVVVSAGFVHKVGKEFGSKTAAASAERMRVLGEVVRVLKEGGVGVVWDLVHVPEYVVRLRELKMEDIRVSERVTAFMVNSHIVSFRKPSHHDHVLGPNEVRLDWRFNTMF